MSLGVGIIGSGPGVSALHVPTLGRLTDRYRVTHVADGGSGRAAAIAARLGVASSTGDAELVADASVDVVAICSPPDQHAAQVIAAAEAGVRGVFCEKPLALTHEDAEAAIDACRRAGIPLVVGTNHLYDPAWGRARHHLVADAGRVQTVDITVALPPNDRYHAVVSDAPASASGAHRGPPDWSRPVVAAGILRQLVLGLCVHDLPLLRDLAPRLDAVVYATPVRPIGYAIGFVASDVLVNITAAMLPEGADAMWRVRIGTSLDQLDIAFPPSFVHAGGAEVTVRSADGRIHRYPPSADDGYLAEWRLLADAIDGRAVIEYGDLLDDALYAIDLADAVAAAVIAGHAPGATPVGVEA